MIWPAFSGRAIGIVATTRWSWIDARDRFILLVGHPTALRRHAAAQFDESTQPPR
jgi:hypothetical protein